MVTYFTSYPIPNIIGAKKNKKKGGRPQPEGWGHPLPLAEYQQHTDFVLPRWVGVMATPRPHSVTSEVMPVTSLIVSRM